MIGLKVGGIIVAAFIAGTFIASPELRAYAANTVGSADIIDNSVQSVDIKDDTISAGDIAANAIGASEIARNSVGSSEIAANAVGASEIAGVSELIFAECIVKNSQSVLPGFFTPFVCDVNGARFGDVAIVSKNGGFTCFEVQEVVVFPDEVRGDLRNYCSTQRQLGTTTLAIVVFDTAAVITPPI